MVGRFLDVRHIAHHGRDAGIKAGQHQGCEPDQAIGEARWLLHDRPEALQLAQYHMEIEGLFVLEVVVERGLGDAAAPAQLIHRRAAIATRLEEFPRLAEDALRVVVPGNRTGQIVHTDASLYTERYGVCEEDTHHIPDGIEPVRDTPDARVVGRNSKHLTRHATDSTIDSWMLVFFTARAIRTIPCSG